MEDVLDVYCRPPDPARPLVCVDELRKNLVQENVAAEPAKPGQIRREDYTYEKQGASHLFIAVEPHAGRRLVRVTEQRTRGDWARFVADFLNGEYKDAEKVVLVMDNLNTHSSASFYEVFKPEEAKRLADRLEIHYTPKHASWLNIAEIELSVLVRQGLARNIATMQEVCEQARQWQDQRNHVQTKVSWQFSSADARIKLKRLYPVLDEMPPRKRKRRSVTNSP